LFCKFCGAKKSGREKEGSRYGAITLFRPITHHAGSGSVRKALGVAEGEGLAPGKALDVGEGERLALGTVLFL